VLNLEWLQNLWDGIGYIATGHDCTPRAVAIVEFIDGGYWLSWCPADDLDDRIDGSPLGDTFEDAKYNIRAIANGDPSTISGLELGKGNELLRQVASLQEPADWD
jgi:hypothetical protein